MNGKRKLIVPFYFLAFFHIASPPALALLEGEINNIRVYEKAGSAVVNIKSRTVGYDIFFNQIPREGMGSGALIDSKGHVVTNNHVIANSEEIETTMADGQIFPARLIGALPALDLALIKIEAPEENFAALKFGDSKALNVGDKVLAIGNPFGLDRTLTVGVVSSLGRSLRVSQRQVLEDMIQTDASINPGNSGGPLLNSQGDIVGINTAIFSPTGASAGVGFAIPAHKVIEVLPRLKKGGGELFPARFRLVLGLILLYLVLRYVIARGRKQRQ